MIIGVDYRLATQHIGGMGVYIRNTLRELKKIDVNNKYELFDNNKAPLNTNVINKLVGVVLEQYWIQVILPALVTKKRVSVLFSPNPPVPVFSKAPIILTIPDMAFYYDRQINGLVKAYLFITYLVSAHKARIITTFSKNSKMDIQQILKVNEDKIVVVPLAAAKIFQSKITSSPDKLKSLYGISKPYILSTPGSFIPRKNVETLISAYKLLPEVLRSKYQLVIAASTNSSYFNSIRNKVNELKLSSDVVFTGYVPPESSQLVKLYRGAKIFAFPSLYEGFGLPPLEAMNCGIPVIVGNNSSLPEVVGDAGILITNSQQLAKGLEKLLTDKSTYTRLRKAGLKRSLLYSWSSSARLFKNNVVDSFRKLSG